MGVETVGVKGLTFPHEKFTFTCSVYSVSCKIFLTLSNSQRSWKVFMYSVCLSSSSAAASVSALTAVKIVVSSWNLNMLFKITIECSVLKIKILTQKLLGQARVKDPRIQTHWNWLKPFVSKSNEFDDEKFMHLPPPER